MRVQEPSGREARRPADRLLEYGLIGLAFSLPHSLALAQVFAYGSLVCWLWMAVRQRRIPGWHPVLGWGVLAFAAAAVVVSLLGPRPEACLPKLHRLVLYLITFAVAAVGPRPGEAAVRPALRIAFALALGVAVRGAIDVVAMPVAAARVPAGQAVVERVVGTGATSTQRAMERSVIRWLMQTDGNRTEQRLALEWILKRVGERNRIQQVDWFFSGFSPKEQDAFLRQRLARIPLSPPRSYRERLFDQGDMRSPQFYMVALILLVGCLSVPVFTRLGRAGATAAVLATLAGLVLHFKRGAWFAAAAGLGLLAMMARRWKILVALVVVAAGVCALPWTRNRLADLPLQFQSGQGTRADIWLKAAPGIFREYPWGVGYGGMLRTDISSRVPQAEAKQDHLHSNLLQMRAELGWPGLGLWLGWMGAVLGVAAGAANRLRKRSAPVTGLAQAVLAALTALLFNGLAEYNFGTGLIRLLFALLCGLAVTLDRESRAP